jgi:hypothetical protein
MTVAGRAARALIQRKRWEGPVLFGGPYGSNFVFHLSHAAALTHSSAHLDQLPP